MGIADRVRWLCNEYETRDPFLLCSYLGVLISYEPLGKFRGYCINHKDQSVIVLCSQLSDLVARFVCAHELGHALLHKRFNRVFMDAHTKLETGRFENEADKFAAQLLFGEAPLYQEPITNWEMAEIINVPVCNVDARLIELGIYH